MQRAHAPIVTSALPAVAASFAVLTFGGVGKGTWLIHLLAIFLSLLIAVAGNRLIRSARAVFPDRAIIVLTLAGLAMTLFDDSLGPNRWIQLGPMTLYMAPVVIPSFLVVSSVCIQMGGSKEAISLAATFVIAVLLATQPDACQALAMLLGSAAAIAWSRSRALRSALTLVPVSMVTAWAFSRPDPLQPVPYVEGVFALAFEYSLFAGAAVTAGAIGLLAGLYAFSFRGPFWLSAVATYYAALFLCSVAGLTPAPLIGYGAGPLLGFGVMVATSQWVSAGSLPNKVTNIAPTAPDAAKPHRL